MDEVRTTIVVKEIGVGTAAGAGGAGGTGGSRGTGTTASSGGTRILQRALTVIVGLALLAVMIPLGVLALGCVAAVAIVVLLFWAVRRALHSNAPRAANPAAPTADPTRENVRIREP